MGWIGAFFSLGLHGDKMGGSVFLPFFIVHMPFFACTFNPLWVDDWISSEPCKYTNRPLAGTSSWNFEAAMASRDVSVITIFSR